MTDPALAHAIVRARTRHGLTQAELADRLGISRSTVAAWETGRSLPSDELFQAMKDVLGRIRREYGREHQNGPRPALATTQLTARRGLPPKATAAPQASQMDTPVTAPPGQVSEGAPPRARGRRAKETRPTMGTGPMDVPALEQWLWDAACQIRGALDAPKFKDYILPLVFLKRLSDVFDDEVTRAAAEFGNRETALEVIASDHEMVRFFIPPEGRWSHIANRTTGLGELLTDAVRAVARQNPKLQGVIDSVDFNATTAGQRIVDDDRLSGLVKTLGQHRLGLNDVQPDLLGRAYEYLIRKFAEGGGQSAGEFFTPPEVCRLMARILDPQPGMSVYDPACGSGGLLIKAHLRLLETHGIAVNEHRELPPDVAPLKLYGQEINTATFAMARMNAFLHDMDASIALGDTMRRPSNFGAAGGKMAQFDLVVANPMWNQDFPDSVYRDDSMERFSRGIPPASTGDWGWVQHMAASLKPGGRMAIVLDTGAVSRGSGYTGANRERDIRKAFVDADLVEAVVLLPDNLFYNTSAPGIVMVLNSAKDHPREIVLINATTLVSKGRPKNYLAQHQVARVHELFQGWASVVGLAAIVTTGQVAENDYNLSPSRYVTAVSGDEVPPLQEAVRLLREAQVKRTAADAELWNALTELGVG